VIAAPRYSAGNATTGSVLAARLGGMMLAASAASDSSAATNARGSFG
jgi:hypothetical protein